MKSSSSAKPAPVILCVEDQASALLVRKMVLEKSGYTVLGATSGSEALRLLKAHDVDLVLSDHFLRNELGTEIATQIKALKPKVRVLIISGSEDIPNVQAVDGVISKAEGPTNLLVSVARALGL